MSAHSGGGSGNSRENRMTGLPPCMIEQRRKRYVHDLRPGQSGYVTWTALKAGRDGRCVVDMSEWLSPSAGDFTIEVRREENGYHVVVPANMVALRMKFIWWIVMPFGWRRVKSITVLPAKIKDQTI